jgi:methylaspartate ammonia-lyase
MKITDVVLSKGLTGYYLDDKHAIQKGAKLDGNFYHGDPVTEGTSLFSPMTLFRF